MTLSEDPSYDDKAVQPLLMFKFCELCEFEKKNMLIIDIANTPKKAVKHYVQLSMRSGMFPWESAFFILVT